MKTKKVRRHIKMNHSHLAQVLIARRLFDDARFSKEVK